MGILPLQYSTIRTHTNNTASIWRDLDTCNIAAVPDTNMGQVPLVIAPHLGGGAKSPCTTHTPPTLSWAHLDEFVSPASDKMLSPNIHSIYGCTPTAIKLSDLRTIIRLPVANLVCGGVGGDVSFGRELESKGHHS